MYLTVKEASDLTGKSATTIYRLCNKRRNSLYIKKEDNKFFINKEFLLATYPPEEKRISQEIEHGSVEITEPVFLEIEPKKTEEISIPVREEQISEIIENNIIEPDKELKSEEQLNIEEIIPEMSIVIENQEQEDSSSPQKSATLERFIGVSISVLALIVLLLLFYYYSK